MKTYPITLQQEPLFWLGDKFYKVDRVEVDRYYTRRSSQHKKVFETNCPSCNNTRKISYKGFDGNNYEAECPICKWNVGHGVGNRIEILNWKVYEYFVHKISAQGPEKVSAYKDGTGYIDTITLKAFCKIGRCMDDYIETNVPSWDNHVDPDLSNLCIENIHDVTDFIFHSKKDAEKYCEMLKDYDRDRLEKFNETYHTEYLYPF